MKFFGIPYQRRQLQFLLGDIVALFAAVALGQVFRFGLGAENRDLLTVLQYYTGSSLFFFSSNLIVLYLADAYNADIDFRRKGDILRLWTAVACALPLQFLAYAAFPHGWWGRAIAVFTSLAFALLLTAWRPLLCSVSPRTGFRQRTIIFGSGRAAQLLARVIEAQQQVDGPHDLVGLVNPPANGRRRHDDAPDEDWTDSATSGPPVLGGVGDLVRLVEQHGIQRIIVAGRGSVSGDVAKQLLRCKTLGVQIEDMPTIYKRLTGKVPILHLTDSWLIFGPVFSGTSRLATSIQRIADVLIALAGAAISAPIVALAVVVIRLESKGPAFFTQERLGRNEVPFRIIKLRTMRDDAESKTGAVWSQGADDPRVTRVGRFLRRSRIDELPQFINVLKGDMSMVGPRPEREHFVTQLKDQIPFYALRFSVKPGVTGWAQVRYRYGASVEDSAEKLCYDLYAIQEMGPALYALIVLKTVQTVLLRPGS